MRQKNSTLIFGFVAFGIYALVVGVLIFYFNFKHTQKPKHYVTKNTPTKNEQAITISLEHLTPLARKKVVKYNKKIIHKKVIKKKRVKKTIVKKRVVKKKLVKKRVIKKRIIKQKVKRKQHKKITHKKTIIKKRIIKKKVTQKKVITKQKKPIVKNMTKKSKEPKIMKKKTIATTKSLFANVSVKKRTPKKVEKKKKILKKKIVSASSLFSSLKKPKKADRGIENSYLAKIEKTLKGWPAQSDYVGQKAKVWLKIKPSGYFEFKVISASRNSDFNKGLKSYLKQLQEFGFGKHRAKRAYTLNVEFVATQ